MTRKRQRPTERRRHQRFKVQEDNFAMVTPLSAKRGEILDVSKGGLALNYVPGKEKTRISIEIDLFLHIFSRDINFCLLRLPIRTISDVQTEDEVADEGKLRRSVEFGALSQSQADQLRYFIDNYTNKLEDCIT